MSVRLIRCEMAALMFGLALTVAVSANTYYVATSGVDTNTGTNGWTDALLTISNAVAKAQDNDTVIVSNGAYVLTAQIAISKAITLSGLSTSPADTVINGNYPTTTNRCLDLNNAKAWVAGFTITNGCDFSLGGGGIRVQRGNLTNCIITGNRCYKDTDDSIYGGGGLCFITYSGSVWNCTISANICSNDGGGIKMIHGGPWIISGCTISGNSTTNTTYRGYGGGINSYHVDNGLCISNCVVASNLVYRVSGGGIYLNLNNSTGEIVNCVISGNYTPRGGAGGIGFETTCLMRNCLIFTNTCRDDAGGIMMHDGQVQNCTISGNRSTGGGAPGPGGIYVYNGPSFIENSISWANISATAGSSNYWLAAGMTISFSNSCVAPAIASNATATDCIASDPLFVSIPGGKYQLQSGSPAINAGVNRAWMTGATDLDGRPRIDQVIRRVDIGCYEFLPACTLFTVR